MIDVFIHRFDLTARWFYARFMYANGSFDFIFIAYMFKIQNLFTYNSCIINLNTFNCYYTRFTYSNCI